MRGHLLHVVPHLLLSVYRRIESVPESKLSTIEEAVEAISQGKVIIVMDDEDRENEGDFVCAAESVTTEIVNFMITNGRGQLCMPLLPDDCKRLNLPPMVNHSNCPLGTGFTVPIDHRRCRTGITAGERAMTILEAVNPESKPGDFVRPGHLFPLLAKEGGVLRRAGHTEAAIDLTRMAECRPAGVLCEILSADGNRATRDELYKLAEIHELKIITIEQLIKYRRRMEKLIFRIAEADMPTKVGPGRIFAYGIKFESEEPVAIVWGDPTAVEAPLVRLHSSCFTGDLIDSLRCDCGDQLRMAMEMIGKEGVGVLVYLPQEGRGIGLAEKIKAYKLQDDGMDTVEANLALGHQADSRDYGVGIQILKDLGISKIRLLTNNPKKVDAFVYGGFDLEVVDQIQIVGPINKYNERYITTKRDKMGHNI
jgi:3,4-dihydroxy 2-butanone 4-phosphate synthase / GTP cyclohydrolase II